MALRDMEELVSMCRTKPRCFRSWVVLPLHFGHLPPFFSASLVFIVPLGGKHIKTDSFAWGACLGDGTRAMETDKGNPR